MQGLHISPVQEAALELLLVDEERLKAASFVERFKLAVLGHDPKRWLPVLFPGWVKEGEPHRPSDAEVVDATTEDLSDTEGTWIFEDSEVTPEEAERALAEMLDERGGSLSLEDFEPGQFGNWEE